MVFVCLAMVVARARGVERWKGKVGRQIGDIALFLVWGIVS